MSGYAPETFHFRDHSETVDMNEFYDLIFYAPYRFCDWLLVHGGWRDLDQVCQSFHRDHVEMLGQWAAFEVAKLPEPVRNPVDGTVRDIPTLLRFLAGAFPWMVANEKFNKAHCDYGDGAPTIAGEEAVRAAAKDLIDAALGYPPPYRETIVQRSLAWTDFTDRRWLQGLNIPPPWGGPRKAR